ncbi:TerB family tellurite resistance protein [Chitinophaga silvisoli]|uniref:TerB family tellurite resistance protein n=1 Tax=Chitinophaga silvisoli TaxID=2291814 RepID=A0A3E1P354_9BACT|nr:TerB family tellurite resistance protein [Chitinophaga silvisoli]RFM34428.1 TerB family tellurite resistance protein [Chitinophaga silvisoli]
MKWLFGLLVLLFIIPRQANAQATELAQLALNVEKLSQLKSILQDMYKGYEILSEGYNKVKDVASGNYKLHEVFLDGLYIVSPEVKKYKRVGDIISCQLAILKEGKEAWINFGSATVFQSSYREYISRVFNNLYDASLRNLSELTMVITSGSLRMSDDERLKAIDRIYTDVHGKLTFLRLFNIDTRTYMVNLIRESGENDGLQNLLNLK